MFGFNNQGIQEYARINIETGVESASPHRLIVMLYEGAIRACNDAVVFMDQKQIAQKGVALTKAISIIESGLRLSLDKNSGGAIAQSLDALYEYMVRQLTYAHINNDKKPVYEVIKLLSDIKSAWEAIANLDEAKKPHSNVAKLSQTTQFSKSALAKI